MFFQRKPKTVRAWRYEGAYENAPEWIDESLLLNEMNGELFIMTPDGRRKIEQGDWLLADEDGIVFPMDHVYFSRHYEPVQMVHTSRKGKDGHRLFLAEILGNTQKSAD